MKSQIILTLLFISALATVERDSNQEALEGVWSYFNQKGPFTVTKCGTDQDHKDAFLFTGYFLRKADIAQTSEINPLIAEGQQFYNSLPLETRNCFENNQEVIDLGKFLGIDKYTEDELQNKVSNWVGTHFFVYKRLIKTAGSDWNKWEDYEQTGRDLAELLQRILTDAQEQ
ncbi:unnamed protein product [Paramecium primaurelia]|uniref:Uncharacterized protein n=1 Tax=Paramecium primaurelia TaxID=5886 RepID=A0A8S1LLQ9_PARPR|nr:unnamed protein product [Paramecium primaurelia]